MLSLQFAFNILLVAAIIVLADRHKRDTAKIHKEASEERQALLDRIMSNNIHEFKAASGQTFTKRSESGNFLIDRMTAKPTHFTDLEE